MIPFKNYFFCRVLPGLACYRDVYVLRVDFSRQVIYLVHVGITRV